MFSWQRVWKELRLAAIAAGCVGMSLYLSTIARGAEPSADAMMLRAHNGRAVWNNFPGFTAKVRCKADGSVCEGKVTVEPNGKIKLTLAQEDAKFTWAQRTLDSVIGHRLSTDDGVKNVEFADTDENHPQGRLIRSLDKTDKSLWRAKGDVLTEVHRFSEKSHFVISVTEVSRTSEGTHLPHSYVVTTWETPSERIQQVRQIHQEWTRVGKLDVPAKYLAITNKSDGSRTAQEIEFSEYQLTTPVAAR